MKKWIVALGCVAFLCGCQSQAELSMRVLTQLQQLPQQKLSIGVNQVKPLYSYYLPAGVGRRESNELSEVLLKDGYRVIMNFDPSAIVIHTYYRESQEDTQTTPTQKQELIKQFQVPTMEQDGEKWIYTGNYLTTNQEVFPYTLQLLKHEDSYLIYFDTTLLKLYTYVPEAEVSSMLKMMVLLSSSLEYEERAVLQQYSMKFSEKHNENNLHYLEQVMPATGSLQDLLEAHPDIIEHGDMPK